MRVKELHFSTTYDVTNALIGDMHRLLESNKSIFFENNVAVLDYKEFIVNQKSLLPIDPIPGETYAPVGLNASPMQAVIAIQQPQGVMTFIKNLPNNRFQFEYQNMFITYPFASRNTLDLGDMLLDTLLCKTINDADQFITLLTLKFSHWTIFKR